MSRTTTNIAVVLAAYLLTQSAFAGWTPPTKIVLIQAHAGDRVFIKTEIHNQPPSCAEALKEWAIDVSTDTGKAIYSAALAAASQGKNVEIHGNANCNFWSDREDILRIAVPY